MHQNFILIHIFFYFNCLPDDVLCKIAIWADDIALNSHTCRNKLRWTINCNLILKIKISEKYFYFSSFFFFKCQDLLLNIIRSSSKIKSCCPELNFKKLFQKLEIPTRTPVEFYKNVPWNQFFYSLQSIPILCIRKWCTPSDADEFFPRQFPVFVFNFISRKSRQT